MISYIKMKHIQVPRCSSNNLERVIIRNTSWLSYDYKQVKVVSGYSYYILSLTWTSQSLGYLWDYVYSSDLIQSKWFVVNPVLPLFITCWFGSQIFVCTTPFWRGNSHLQNISKIYRAIGAKAMRKPHLQHLPNTSLPFWDLQSTSIADVQF